MNKSHEKNAAGGGSGAAISEKLPLYNSRIINTFIKLVKRRYSYVDISDLLEYANMEPYQVEDEGHWFTQEQVDLFYERLLKLTGEKDLAREAGRYAASPETIGVMRQYALGLVGPAKAYEMVGKYASNFSRSADLSSRKIKSNKFEITVIPKEGTNEKAFQCENRIGYFEAIAKLFNTKLTKIEHSECIFRGGKTCRYIVSWKEAPSDLWRKVRNYAAFFLAVLLPAVYFLYSKIIAAEMFLLALPGFLLLSLLIEHMDKRDVKSALDNLHDSSDKLLAQIDVNYNHALLVNEIGLALNKQMDIDNILSSVIQVLQKRLDYNRGMILLADVTKTRLVFQKGFGYTDDQFDVLRNAGFSLDKPDSKGVFVVSFRERKPFLINDIDLIKDDISRHSLDFAKEMGAKSFICCPIVYEDESLGILAVDNIRTKRPLLQSDISLLMGIAPQIGMSIHNARLLEAKERQFQSILQVMAASIDARDPLTAGHSEKVTDYALGICEELDMPTEFSEMIRVASLLHDYGKIGVKDSILKKQGSLSSEEKEEIKLHTEKTRKILEQVNFEGIYREVPEITAYHHEKIDGSGYPRGLSGEQIPLGSRIIAVADFFEAITAKRHYRDPMSFDEALQLLKEESDRHLDKRIVDAFIRYLNRKQTQGR